MIERVVARDDDDMALVGPTDAVPHEGPVDRPTH